MNNCEIVKDLIPLCVDDAASASSVEFVNQHIASCPECRKVMENMQGTLRIPISTGEQLNGTKPFEKMRKLMTRKIIRTAVISVLVICAVIVMCFLADTRNLLGGEPLLTEGEAAYKASLKARAYLEFHMDEFPAADYDAIEPSVAVELVEQDEEFFTMVYKVRVQYDVPDSAEDPAFEMRIDAVSGDTLKTTRLN